MPETRVTFTKTSYRTAEGENSPLLNGTSVSQGVLFHLNNAIGDAAKASRDSIGLATKYMESHVSCDGPFFFGKMATNKPDIEVFVRLEAKNGLTVSILRKAAEVMAAEWEIDGLHLKVKISHPEFCGIGHSVKMG